MPPRVSRRARAVMPATTGVLTALLVAGCAAPPADPLRTAPGGPVTAATLERAGFNVSECDYHGERVDYIVALTPDKNTVLARGIVRSLPSDPDAVTGPPWTPYMIAMRRVHGEPDTALAERMGFEDIPSAALVLHLMEYSSSSLKPSASGVFGLGWNGARHTNLAFRVAIDGDTVSGEWIYDVWGHTDASGPLLGMRWECAFPYE